jgi:hypothetical protein
LVDGGGETAVVGVGDDGNAGWDVPKSLVGRGVIDDDDGTGKMAAESGKAAGELVCGVPSDDHNAQFAHKVRAQ